MKTKEEALLRLGSGGRFEKLNVLLAADAGFDLSEHSVGLICANALNTRRVVYDVPNRRVALLVDGVDVSPCESLLCAGPLDWERVTRTPDGTALPTPRRRNWSCSARACGSGRTSERRVERRVSNDVRTTL